MAATKDAKRLDRKDAPTLTKIPVMPISYADALPLLQALEGPVAPEAWRGALPITYHFGPGPAKVHLKLEFDWKLVPAHDVIAVMKGADVPDEWVLRGNHHDAWVNGADDPVSGAVALMEEARVVGELAKAGCAPEAHHRVRRSGTAKSRACSAPPSGWRRTATSCGRRPWPTSTPTATPAASSTRAAPIPSSPSWTRSRAT